MIWLAVIGTFGATFLLVWQILNVLVGRLRWLPKSAIVVTDREIPEWHQDPDWDDPDSALEETDL